MHATCYGWQSLNRFGPGKGTAKPVSEKVKIRTDACHDDALFRISAVDILNISVNIAVKQVVDPNVVKVNFKALHENIAIVMYMRLTGLDILRSLVKQ